MPKEITYDDNTQETFFTAEDMEARAKEESDKVAAEKDAEIQRLQKLNTDKTENFKKFNEMTEEERKAYDANTLNLIKRGDNLEEKLTNTAKTLEEKEKAERDRTKNNTFKELHGDIPDVKAKLEEKYAALAGMPETTPEEIQSRAMEAARLSGISVDSRNPLFQSFNGAPPKPRGDNGEFVDTPEGKTAAEMARKALEIPEPK